MLPWSVLKSTFWHIDGGQRAAAKLRRKQTEAPPSRYYEFITIPVDADQ